MRETYKLNFEKDEQKWDYEVGCGVGRCKESDCLFKCFCIY